MKIEDKQIEKNRYESRAIDQLKKGNIDNRFNLESFPCYLRKPYEVYENYIKNLIPKNSKVLEIGSGTGNFTGALIKTGANVFATDISPASLEVLKIKFKNFNNIETHVVDMEKMPFQNESFDFIVSAGCLSYGDHEIVLNEIYRLIKRGGDL